MTENMQDKSKRIEWIDTAKGMGLLLVIAGHLNVPYLSTWIYFFHMPLFLFLSGVVFSPDKYTFKDFLIKKIKTLVVPYFSLGFIIWLFYIVVNLFVGQENGLYGTNLEMLEKLLIQKHFWTIWFLACLFFTELLYFAIAKLLRNHMVFMTVLSLGICAVGLLRYHFGYGSLPWNLDVALVAQFFFHGGYVFKNWKNMREYLLDAKCWRYCILTISFLGVNLLCGALCIKVSGASLDMSVGLYGNVLLTMLSAFAGILFVVMLAQKIQGRWLIYLGRNTMIIFAWHSRIVIVGCNYLYESIGIFHGDNLIERLGYAIVTFVVIVAILVPINEMIKRCRFHKIFGV